MRLGLFWVQTLFWFSMVQCEESKLIIRSLDIVSGVRMRFVTTHVKSVVENLGDQQEEYSFVSYLPENAFVTNFTMEVDNYQSIASLRPRTEAEDLYEIAKQTGATAATTSADANVFTTKLSIAPNKSIAFQLTYEEVLERHHGVYKHVINVQPNLEAEKITTRVRIVERGRIDRNKLRVPRFGFAIGSYTNEELLEAPQEVGVVVKSSITDKISVIDIAYDPTESGQLVVLYDMERGHDAGHMEVVNGYFLHFFSPSDEVEMKGGAKSIMFILDASYSMCGQRWDHMKNALAKIWRELKPTDYFNVLTFNTDTHAWKLRSMEATLANIRDALKYLDTVVHRGGGSNIHQALKTGIDMLRIDEADPMVSMVIFITDGHTNKGVQNPDALVRSITDLNKHAQYSIHTLALGREADFPLLEKISSHNGGISRKIYEETADSKAQIMGFFREVESPMLNSIKFRYHNSAVDVKSLVAQQGVSSKTFRKGGEVIVAGRINKDMKTPIKVEVRGKNSKGKEVNLLSTSVMRRSPHDSGAGFVERMWALLTVKKLLKSARGSMDKAKRKFLRRKALRLCRKYNFVTEITSFLVIPLELKSSKPTAATVATTKNSQEDGFERSAVLREIIEESRDQWLSPSQSTSDESLVAGRPMQESVVPVDSLRGGWIENGRPGSQSEVLEQNSIATDPLVNVALKTLIDIANPTSSTTDIRGVWRNTYVGPITKTVQGYARLLPSLDPGTKHFADRKLFQRNCGKGEKLDVVFAIDITDTVRRSGALAGPGMQFILKSMVQRAIGSFTFNRQHTRIGLAAFSHESDKGEIIYKLNQNQNPNALINIVRKLDSSAMLNGTYNVLNLSYDILKASPRPGAKQFIVLLSGEDAYGRHRVTAEKLRERDIEIIAVAPHQKSAPKLNQLAFITGKDSNVITEPNPKLLTAKFCDEGSKKVKAA